MDFVVLGAGAIGSVVGARLFESGHQVTLVARGAHLEALRRNGLTVETPDGEIKLDLPVVDDPRRTDSAGDVVVLLCVKSQQTAAALPVLGLAATATTPVVCVQKRRRQ